MSWSGSKVLVTGAAGFIWGRCPEGVPAGPRSAASCTRRHGDARPDRRGPSAERQSRYAATKIGADQLALSFLRSFETPVVVARPFNTFGPRQSARAVIPTLITQALALESVELGSTHPTRDFLYVEDLARGFRRCVEADGVEGEVINLGTGTEISIADLAETVLRLVGWESALSYSEDRARTAAERGRAAAGRHEQGAAAPGLVARGLPRGGPAADDRVVARLARRLQAFDLQRLAR